MYQVRNKGFDWIYLKYSVSSLEEMDDKILMDLCLDNPEVNAEPLYTERKEGGRVVSKTFDRYKTIDKIRKNFTVDLYLSKTYWTQKQVEMAAKRGIEQELTHHTSGDETFEFFKSLGWGVAKLKPGEVQNVEWPDRFVKEYLNGNGDEKKAHPVMRLLELTEIGKEEASKGSVLDIDTLTPQELKTLAKEQGIRYVGVQIDWIKAQLKTKMAI